MIVEEGMNTYISSMTTEQLKDYLKSVGKAANERLRALERQGLEQASASYRYINRLAEDKDYATSRTGAGQIKFNLRVRGRSQAELRHMAAKIEGFMSAPSSTVGGMKDITARAAQTFKARGFGSEQDYKKFSDAMAYSIFRSFEKIYGSDEAVKLTKKAEGLTSDELYDALNAAGFTESTTESGAPTLSQIYNAIDTFKENMRGFDDDEWNELFDEDDIL